MTSMPAFVRFAGLMTTVGILVGAFPIPVAAHYYPDHGGAEWRSRSGVAPPGLTLDYSQSRGCGFSPVEVDVLINAGLHADTPKATVRFEWGDSEPPFEATLTTESPALNKFLFHTYPEAREGTLQKYNPRILVDGNVLWEAKDAAADGGPWQVWVVGKRSDAAYMGHDHVIGPPFTRAQKSVVSAKGIDVGQPSSLSVNADGRVSANYARWAVGFKVFDTQIGAPAEVKLDAQVGQTKLRVEQGCSLVSDRPLTVKFGHAYDVSIGLNPGGGSATGFFKGTLHDGTGSSEVLAREFSSIVLPAGDRITGEKTHGRSTTYKADSEYDVYMQYEIGGSTSSIGGNAEVSMGEGNPDYSNIALLKLGPMRVASLTLDWTKDVHGWQG